MSNQPSPADQETAGIGSAGRLLIAEDDPVSRSILAELAESWGYETVVVGDGHRALEALERDDAPRLAILDWMMPGVDGVEICRQLRGDTGSPYTYVIMLTAHSDSDRMIEAMEAGADDFLGKPFQPHELEVRLRAGRRIVELQAELIEAREALRELATIDALTRTWNRASILERLDQALARESRERRGRGPGILMADLDHFKRINDSHGHRVGDQVLTEVGGRIRALLRRQDDVGRIGGEEFLVIVGDCDEEGLERAAERIRFGIGGRPVDTDAGKLRVTISIGGVVFDLAEAVSGAALVELADTAMYRAKRAGRNRVVVGAG